MGQTCYYADVIRSAHSTATLHEESSIRITIGCHFIPFLSTTAEDQNGIAQGRALLNAKAKACRVVDPTAAAMLRIPGISHLPSVGIGYLARHIYSVLADRCHLMLPHDA